jgi:hypothetical protein
MNTRQILLLTITLITGCYISACDSDESCTGPTITPYLEFDSISAIYYNEYSNQISDSVTVIGIYSEYRFVHRPGRIIGSTYRFILPFRWPDGINCMFDRCVLAPVPTDTTISRYGELELIIPYIPGIDTAVVVLTSIRQ